MATPLNTAFMKLTRRAETNERDKLIQTFVDVGPLFTLLSSSDHQILYGRRGTGKTHALAYLAENRQQEGDLVAYVDLRNIGSSGGVYADPNRSITERATCLLVDTLSAVHEELLRNVLADDLDLSVLGPALDELGDAIVTVRVVGTVEAETSSQSTGNQSRSEGVSFGGDVKGISLTVESKKSTGQSNSEEKRIRREGREQHYVNFGSTGSAFRRLASSLPARRVWVLLDEWSSVPLDLQPYLADLLRRSLFPTPGITVKIAAIEQRTEFRIPLDGGNYVGIEVGADASADVNLDDYMVFDNDSSRASVFFQNLLERHVAAIDPELTDVARQGFTQTRAFEEFVRSSEGVPRDAINIIALAAQRALDEPVSVEHIRRAAASWYQRDKDKVVSENSRAHALLHWIIDRVIGERRARAFLLNSSTSDELIDDLYDARVLHVLKRGVSTHDQPGVRFNVLKLDYGCYVDLVNTTKAPQGLFRLDIPEKGAEFIEVPPDDYRSIRRAILDLEQFYDVQT